MRHDAPSQSLVSVDEPGTGRRRLLGAACAVVAVVAWTATALPFLAVATFAMADTSCNGPPQLQIDALWWPGTVVGIWLSPFVAIAARRRSRSTVSSAVCAVVVASAVSMGVLLEPPQFCF